MRIRLRWFGCVLACGLSVTSAAARNPDTDTALFARADSRELDRAVRDVCRKDIVLLGEDADHGSGRTLEIKGELVKRLVSRCGFRAIVFESAIYGALELERALAAGRATEDDVVDAGGQLWFWAREARPMTAFLLQEARAGRVRIGGMDMSPNALPGRYSGTRLGADVASVLEPGRRDVCAVEIQRHARWQYDDATPFDDAAQQRLRACIDEMRAAVAADPARTTPDIARGIAALSQYMAMAAEGDESARDRAMFENLMWYRERWPKGTRVIVWCATVHAAKTLDDLSSRRRPLGAYVRERDGDRAAVIGFTALAGEYGNLGGRAQTLTMPAAIPESLDARVLAGHDAGLRYVDRKRLARFGTSAARALTYRKVHALPWAKVLDGMIVLRREHPTTPIGK